MRTGRHGTAWVAPPRSGFTLVEMLVVMWALGILMLVGTAALIATLKVQRAAGEAHQQLILRTVLADQFRGDVAEASSAPDSVGNVQSGPTCLILRLPDGTLLVYRCEDGQVERSKSIGDNTVRTMFPLGSETTTVEFSRDNAHGRLIGLRLIESPWPG